MCLNKCMHNSHLHKDFLDIFHNLITPISIHFLVDTNDNIY